MRRVAGNGIPFRRRCWEAAWCRPLLPWCRRWRSRPGRAGPRWCARVRGSSAHRLPAPGDDPEVSAGRIRDDLRGDEIAAIVSPSGAPRAFSDEHAALLIPADQMGGMPSLRLGGPAQDVPGPGVHRVVAGLRPVHDRMIASEGGDDVAHEIDPAGLDPLVGADLVVVGIAHGHDGGWLEDPGGIEGPFLLRADPEQAEAIARQRDVGSLVFAHSTRLHLLAGQVVQSQDGQIVVVTWSKLSRADTPLAAELLSLQVLQRLDHRLSHAGPGLALVVARR